jgi:hypothetical protein
MEAQQTPELLAQQLWDIEQIKQLKARYFRFLDTRNWDGFADLFTEDCKHYGYFADDPSRTLVGLAEYLPFLKGVVTPGRSVHHGHMPEITLTSPTGATGIWAMFDHVESQPASGPVNIEGYGHYHETYRKCTDGKWRISSKRLDRLWVNSLSTPD